MWYQIYDNITNLKYYWIISFIQLLTKSLSKVDIKNVNVKSTDLTLSLKTFKKILLQ